MTGEAFSNLRAATAMVLLGLSLPALGWAYARALSVWRGREAAGPRGVLLGALGVAALLRWVVAPRWIVTIYIGYLLTAQAIELSALSHYGMGSLALYHALFAFLPHDHRSLLWTNSIVGVLALPLAATFVARLFRDRWAGAVFGGLVALVPLFVKNDNSDANNVPCLWWLFGGLVLWEQFLDTGSRRALAGATVLLAAATTGRPEMPVLVPVLLAIFTLGLAPARGRLRDPALLAAAPVFGLLVAPHVYQVATTAVSPEQREGLPGLGGGVFHVLRMSLRLNTPLDPTLFPLALLAFAALGLVLRAGPGASRARRPAAALLVASVVSLAIYGIDLCRANMARVHVPGALFLTMLAAAGMVAAWRRLRSRALRALIPAAFAVTAALTVRPLWAPTNEQAEEELLRESLAHLPAEPHVLVRFDRADRDRASPYSDSTHHHHPDYLFRPPMGTGRVSSVRDFLDQPDFERPAFFYLGMRCHAELRPAETPPPRGEALQAACAAMRERFDLEPVFERVVPNRGDVWLEYYGDAPELRLGLYRVRPRRAASR